MTPLDVSISSQLTDADIRYVCDLARRAGKIAAEMREGVAIAEKSGPHDRVTDADVELSRIITGQLMERFANDVVISEEEIHPTECSSGDRIWLVDPIDGTDNYIRNDGQYAVMIGLLVGMQPVFGWVYAPVPDQAFYGGPQDGSWEQSGDGPGRRIVSVPALKESSAARVMMGFRDRKNYPWVNELPEIEWVKSGSVGLKVGKILEDKADMFIHLSGKLKVWDTAGPIAIALGAGLEVGRLDSGDIGYPLPKIEHDCSVIIGRSGSLAWSRSRLIKSES